MKKCIFVLLALLMLCSGCSGQIGFGTSPNPSIIPKSESEEVPEGAVQFEIANTSGGDIYEAFVADADTKEFGADILKEKIIKTGESMSVYIMPIENIQYYDIKVLREDGEYYTWLNVPIGTFKKINLSLGAEGPEFTTE